MTSLDIGPPLRRYLQCFVRFVVVTNPWHWTHSVSDETTWCISSMAQVSPVFFVRFVIIKDPSQQKTCSRFEHKIVDFQKWGTCYFVYENTHERTSAVQHHTTSTTYEEPYRRLVYAHQWTLLPRQRTLQSLILRRGVVQNGPVASNIVSFLWTPA